MKEFDIDEVIELIEECPDELWVELNEKIKDEQRKRHLDELD